ncbi:MAG: histidine kinase [Bacteroidia bacterium]
MRQLLHTSFILVLFLISGHIIVAQDTLPQQQMSIPTERKSKKISKIVRSLEKSYSENDDLGTAKNYENLAKAYSDENEYTKAEDNLKKALQIYTKQNLKDDKARVSRNLAKVQEKLGKYDDAASSYKMAQDASNDIIEYSINSNDMNRLLNYSNPQVQSSYSKSNMQLYQQRGQKQEIADAYVQQAQSDLQQKNVESALNNYSSALHFTENNSTEEIKIKDEIANLYLNTNQTEKAKEIKNEIISGAQQSQDITTEIKQKQSLATIYLQEENNEEAVKLLQESYEKALASSNTLEAKKSLELLISYYRNKGNYTKSIALYDEFLKKLDLLVKADSSLMDTELIAATEEKIKQLEKEKKLQDELITKTNRFNYVLGGAVILIIIFLLLVIRAFYSVKNKNKEIALQSLRREMNPHFIFNSLNSVNQFIAQNNELEANKYLSSYSNLMRTIMENSNKDFILMSHELELVKKYLALEHLRFNEKFDYSIIVDEELDAEGTYVPNMILQPQLENAIWHGLRYKEKKGMLTLKFILEGKGIRILIEDDGIGLARSKELKTMNQKVHESRGLNNTLERIKLLNELYKKNIELSIRERKDQEGTVVSITFPLINKL